MSSNSSMEPVAEYNEMTDKTTRILGNIQYYQGAVSVYDGGNLFLFCKIIFFFFSLLFIYFIILVHIIVIQNFFLVCSCKYGSCLSDGPECTCHDGFTGQFCDKRKNSFQPWLLAIIIVIPFVSCLIIAIYACMFYYLCFLNYFFELIVLLLFVFLKFYLKLIIL